jgi:putative Flp pilus-assembly TadE/G-like protein
MAVMLNSSRVGAARPPQVLFGHFWRAGGFRFLFGDVVRDARATVLVLMAFSLLALATATAVGIDFARALSFKTALQGAADAAAIAGASVYLNAGYTKQATTAADAYLTTATNNLPTNNGVASTVALSADSPWTVTVTASAAIKSSFTGLIMPNVPVQVSAVAHAPTNPNIDFYLLLDSSPSMGIAATQAGITTMINNTQGQCDSPPNGGPTCGCGFACHESDPGAESYYLPTGTTNTTVTPHQLCTATPSGPTPPWPLSGSTKAAYYYCPMSGTGNPGGEDNYTLARNTGVTLRIDNLMTATQNLMTTAQTTETSNSATYRVAIDTFDVAFNSIQTLTANLSTAQTSAGKIQQLEMYSNNHLVAGDNNQDADTNFDNAFSQINALMPNPGGGTTAQGDTPQEVLFFVSDGVEDEMVGGTRTYTTVNAATCNAIKNQGIRIAVLYTVYLPLPTNGWYNTYVSPIQPDIASAMQNCASPGLYFQVDTGGDISAAMTALFTTAIQSAYIAK